LAPFIGGIQTICIIQLLETLFVFVSNETGCIVFNYLTLLKWK